MPGCAKRVANLCKEAGLTLTGAGSAYPYHKDPQDSHLRIAPTYPSLDEVETASDLLCVCVKLATVEKLLADQEAENPILVGNVWHNMGKAYTGLFRFREAADCYRKAYGLNENPESLRECLYAYRCLHDDDGFKNTAAECGMTAEEAAEAAHRLSELSRTEEIRQFEEQVDGLFADGQEDEIAGMLAEWKDTYRKNCRI